MTRNHTVGLTLTKGILLSPTFPHCLPRTNDVAGSSAHHPIAAGSVSSLKGLCEYSSATGIDDPHRGSPGGGHANSLSLIHGGSVLRDGSLKTLGGGRDLGRPGRHPALGSWLRAIHSAIEALTPACSWWVGSVDPISVCAQEIEYAVTHNKRIIPIVCRAVDTRAVRIPEPIAKINWVSFVEPDGFQESIATLVSAIETDLDWVKQHTRLLERAVEWDAAKRDGSFLLQKNDLRAAERWLALGPTKDPKPTALQTSM